MKKDVQKIHISVDFDFMFYKYFEASLHRSVSLEMRRTVQNMSYAYDLTANPISKATPDEITVGYVYDNLNRLTSINFLTVLRTSHIRMIQPGKVLSMTDPSGTTAYVYDSSNRLTTETKTIEGKTFNFIIFLHTQQVRLQPLPIKWPYHKL